MDVHILKLNQRESVVNAYSLIRLKRVTCCALSEYIYIPLLFNIYFSVYFFPFVFLFISQIEKWQKKKAILYSYKFNT